MDRSLRGGTSSVTGLEHILMDLVLLVKSDVTLASCGKIKQ